jgi:hypothetical protein
MFVKVNEYIERFFDIISRDCKKYFEEAIEKRLYQLKGDEKCFLITYENINIGYSSDPCKNKVIIKSRELFDIVEKIQEEEREFNEKKISEINIKMLIRSPDQTYSNNYYMTGMTKPRRRDKIVDLIIYVPESEITNFDYRKFEKYLYGIMHHEFTHAFLQKDFYEKSTFLEKEDPDYEVITKRNLKVLSDEEEILVRMPSEVISSIKSLYPFLNYLAKSKIEYWFLKNEIDAHVNHIVALSLFDQRREGINLDNIIESETDLWLDSIEETKNVKIPVAFSDELNLGTSHTVKISGILNERILESQKLLNDALISLGYELSEEEKLIISDYIESIPIYVDKNDAEKVSDILSGVIIKIISDNLEKALRFNISKLLKKNASLFKLRFFLIKQGHSSELKKLDTII